MMTMKNRSEPTYLAGGTGNKYNNLSRQIENEFYENDLID